MDLILMSLELMDKDIHTDQYNVEEIEAQMVLNTYQIL